jgi:hypothetical protein
LPRCAGGRREDLHWLWPSVSPWQPHRHDRPGRSDRPVRVPDRVSWPGHLIQIWLWSVLSWQGLRPNFSPLLFHCFFPFLFSVPEIHINLQIHSKLDKTWKNTKQISIESLRLDLGIRLDKSHLFTLFPSVKL